MNSPVRRFGRSWVRGFVRFGGLLLAVGSVGGACQRSVPADHTILLRAAYTSAVDVGDLPSLIAHRSLEEVGYRVESTFFAQPELAVEALASGGADIANGGTRAFWAAVAKGADLVMVMEHSENGYQLVVAPDIARCEDLVGRTLALSSRGSLPTALGEAYLQRCKSVKPRVLVMPHSGDRLTALIAGAVDAAVLQRADVVRLERRAPGRARVLAAFSTEFPDLDFAGVFVTRRFADSQRRAVRDYVRERIRAHRQVLANPDLLFDEARRWETIAALDQAVVDGEVRAPAWSEDGGLTRTSVNATLDFFARIGSLPSSLTTDQVADFSFVREALHER